MIEAQQDKRCDEVSSVCSVISDFKMRGDLTARLYNFAVKWDYMMKNRRQRILIVDDEPMCLMGIKRMLRAASLVDLDALVDVAMNGYEAVKTVAAAIKLNMQHELIFMDIAMPEMDGIEATASIRKLYKQRADLKQPTIVGVTAHVDEVFRK